jgi:hypothetical protein
MKKGLSWLLTAIVLGIGSIAVAADTPPTVDQVLAVLDDGERANLLKGEIVSKARKEQETVREALSMTIALWVPGTLRDVAERLRAISLLQAKQEGTSKHAISGPVKGDGRSPAFNAMAYTNQEQKEIDMLLSVKPGDKFNLSSEEIGWFQKAAAGLKGKATAKDRGETANATLRRVLESRYLAYSTGGVDALKPYAREKGAQASPAKELAATTESMVILTKYFPAFYQAFRYYPKNQVKAYQNEFLWTRQIEEKRPLFTLEHDMTEISEQYALITSRLYYCTHTLNSLQVAILCMPYRSGTVVGLTNQVFIDLIGRYDNSIVRGVGHSKVESRVRPMFEALKEQYKGKSAAR